MGLNPQLRPVVAGLWLLAGVAAVEPLVCPFDTPSQLPGAPSVCRQGDVQVLLYPDGRVVRIEARDMLTLPAPPDEVTRQVRELLGRESPRGGGLGPDP